MDQTLVRATNEFLVSQIAIKEERIKELEQHVQRTTQRDYQSAGTLQGIRDGMHEWTMSAVQSREISETNAEEIAAICGFELTTEVDVQVMVEYSFSVNVPVGEDVEDIINDITFDNIDYDTDKVSLYNVSIDRIDS